MAFQSYQSKIQTFLGDLSGAFAATAQALPKAIAYGSLVYGVFAPQFLALGIVAGLLSYGISNLTGIAFKGNPVVNSGPSGLPAVMLSAVLAQLAEAGAPAALLPLFLVATSLLVGLVQILFGLLKAGKLARLVSRPVIYGIQNGSALLILVNFFLPFLEKFTKEFSLIQFENSTLITVFALLFGVVSFLFKFKRIWPLFCVGSGILVSLFTSQISIPEKLFAFNLQIPLLAFQNLTLIEAFKWLSLSPQNLLLFLGTAGGLGVIVSINTLLVTGSVDIMIRKPENVGQELVLQGVGNSLAGLIGGIPGDPSYSRSYAAHLGGARTHVSRILAGLMGLVAFVFSRELQIFFTEPILRALIIATGFTMFDFDMIKNAFKSIRFGDPRKWLNFFDVLALVVVVAALIFLGIFEAVIIGIILSSLHFALRMGQRVVRRVYSAEGLTGMVEWHGAVERTVTKGFSNVKIIELNGALYFATANEFVQTMLKLLVKQGLAMIIYDMSRCHEIDGTGMQQLIGIEMDFRDKNVIVAYAGVSHSKSLARLLHDRPFVFDRTEDALQWYGDKVYDEEYDEIPRIAIEGFPALQDLSPDEKKILLPMLKLVKLKSGKVLFEHNSSGRSIFFITSGCIQVQTSIYPQRRLVTMTAGSLLGEMALLEGKGRSGTALAACDSELYRLSERDWNHLSKRHPEISLKLTRFFAVKLSERLRRLNQEILLSG
ncbi:MAG: SLC26A/SulP transporter family protein [Spirochaetales bacterium]|nr:SLC26A/SulP transporter family protein [Spirochaetales bacterium]